MSIRRYVLHLEWHRGYRPRVYIRRAARHGARTTDGGQPGILQRCSQCSGDGFLFLPDGPDREMDAP